jgi:dihydrodipicolinate synthase/N-acetylneuraminate lyase
MPVFAYNNPSLTSKAIDIELVKKFSAVGVKAMKDSSLNRDLANSIKEFSANEGVEFEYISGSTKDWPYFNSIGVKAMIAGACNYAPDLVASMYRLSQTADHETFVRASNMVNHISDFIKVGNSLISSHLALTSRGYEVPYMKKPLICPYEEYKDKIREDAEEISKAVELIKELDPEYRYVEM